MKNILILLLLSLSLLIVPALSSNVCAQDDVLKKLEEGGGEGEEWTEECPQEDQSSGSGD